MSEHDDAVERFARRHFHALQQAGLKTWTFAEFRAFCAPQLRCMPAIPAAEAPPPSLIARRFADAVGEQLQTRYGESLGPRSRERIIRTAQQSLVACNRRHLRLVQRAR